MFEAVIIENGRVLIPVKKSSLLRAWRMILSACFEHFTRFACFALFARFTAAQRLSLRQTSDDSAVRADNIPNFADAEQKLEYLFQHYKQTVFYAAKRVLKDEWLAEDVVSETFIRVFRQLDKIDCSDCHKTRRFFVVIAENLAIDFYRKESKVRLLPLDEEYLPSSESLYELEGGDELEALLLKLPLAYAAILRLKYIEEFKDAEIADLLQISAANVRKRLERAKKALKSRLTEQKKVHHER